MQFASTYMKHLDNNLKQSETVSVSYFNNNVDVDIKLTVDFFNHDT